jgi:hypothetical protein
LAGSSRRRQQEKQSPQAVAKSHATAWAIVVHDFIIAGQRPG